MIVVVSQEYNTDISEQCYWLALVKYIYRVLVQIPRLNSDPKPLYFWSTGP